MRTAQEQKELDETRESLERMQGFDVSTLPREADLGKQLNFQEAVEPAQQLIALYKRLSIAALEDFPLSILGQIKGQANSDYNLLKQILEFNSSQSNPQDSRRNLIQRLVNEYPTAFNSLHPFISYSLHRSADFQRLDQEARATLQGIEDKAKGQTEELAKARDEAKRILEEIRNVAAEQGVGQQAIYFRDASKEHADEATKWQKRTIWVGVVLAFYALGTLFLHKWPFLKPETVYETAQLAVSKMLVFAVISYMLYLCAKNFLSHKHNAIVNKHRQNALLTYTALVEAAGNTPNREVILNHAAACIFSPQSTGYVGDSGPLAPSAKSVVELFTAGK